MISFDRLQNSDGDIYIVGGDFVNGPSDEAHIQELVGSAPGDWRQFVKIGAQAVNFLKSPLSQASRFIKILKMQLKMDGYQNISVVLHDGLRDFEVTAERIK